MDYSLRPRRDQAVDLGVRPGVDVRLQHHLPRPRDAQPTISQQTGADANPGVEAKGEGGEPTETAGRRLFQGHVGAITRQRTSLLASGRMAKLTPIHKTV